MGAILPSMRPAQIAREIRASKRTHHLPCSPSMRPAQIAREIHASDVTGDELVTPSMRPAQIAREILRGSVRQVCGAQAFNEARANCAGN